MNALSKGALKATKRVQTQKEIHPRGTKLRRYDGEEATCCLSSGAERRAHGHAPASRPRGDGDSQVREAQKERRSKSTNKFFFLSEKDSSRKGCVCVWAAWASRRTTALQTAKAGRLPAPVCRSHVAGGGDEGGITKTRQTAAQQRQRAWRVKKPGVAWGWGVRRVTRAAPACSGVLAVCRCLWGRVVSAWYRCLREGQSKESWRAPHREGAARVYSSREGTPVIRGRARQRAPRALST